MSAINTNINTNSVLIQLTSSKWSGESTITPDFEGDKLNAKDMEDWRKKKRMVKVTKRLMDPKLLGGPPKQYGKCYNFIKRKTFPTQFRGLFRAAKDEGLLTGIVKEYEKYLLLYQTEVKNLDETWDDLLIGAEEDFMNMNKRAIAGGYNIEFNDEEYPEFISDEYSMALQMVSIEAPTGLPEVMQSVQTAGFNKLTQDAQDACRETLRQRFATAADVLMEKLADPEKMKEAKSASLDNLTELIKDFDAMNLICEDDKLREINDQCREVIKIVPTIKSIKESLELKKKFQEVFGPLAKSIGDLVSGSYKKKHNLRHI